MLKNYAQTIRFIFLISIGSAVLLFVLKKAANYSQRNLQSAVSNTSSSVASMHQGWFRVSGPSMAPTLLGKSRQWVCDRCRETHFFFLLNPSASMVDCGVCADKKVDVNSLKQCPGDQVQISVYKGQKSSAIARRGELIAVDYQGSMHVKRLVGLPGDTIGLSGSHLTVNSIRLEDVIGAEQVPFPVPWFIVDKDSFSADSVWESVNDSVGSHEPWARDSSGVWNSVGNEPGWLVYVPSRKNGKHIASPIWDDLTFNVGIQRKLFPVDRLRVSGIALVPTRIKVQFWTSEGVKLALREVGENQSFGLSVYDAVDLSSNELSQSPVSQTEPIAISFSGSGARVKDLMLERSLEYRIRPHDPDRYPITLSSSQYFVLGDNVAVSIDSRNWGPLEISSVMGKVDRVSRVLED